jgi:hypothetical protein
MCKSARVRDFGKAGGEVFLFFRALGYLVVQKTNQAFQDYWPSPGF